MDPSHVARLWRAKLVAAQRPSLFDREQFYVPWENVKRITAPDNVTEETLELLGMKRGEYKELVEGKRRILCTLIYSHLTHKFPDFCRSWLGLTISDALLPLRFKIKNEKITPTGSPEWEVILLDWMQSEIYDFYDSQWRFAVPHLTLRHLAEQNESLDPVYHPRTVFPFDAETLPKTTPFSRVWKVKVHTSHLPVIFLDSLKVHDEYPRVRSWKHFRI